MSTALGFRQSESLKLLQSDSSDIFSSSLMKMYFQSAVLNRNRKCNLLQQASQSLPGYICTYYSDICRLVTDFFSRNL